MCRVFFIVICMLFSQLSVGFTQNDVQKLAAHMSSIKAALSVVEGQLTLADKSRSSGEHQQLEQRISSLHDRVNALSQRIKKVEIDINQNVVVQAKQVKAEMNKAKH